MLFEHGGGEGSKDFIVLSMENDEEVLLIIDVIME